MYLEDVNTTHQYSCMQLIAKGGNGSVWKAINKTSGQDVALKVVKFSVPEVFENERRIWASLAHPNIVKLVDSGTHGNFGIFVSELAPGGTLLTALERVGRPLSESEARRCILQLAEAVNYCHQNGMAHRDIKLENILLHGEQIKLTDFGASIHESDLTGGLCNRAAGTVEYVPPEENQRHWFNPFAADIWSLGVVLYILLHLKFPFSKGENGMIYNQPPLRPGLSKEIRDLLTKVWSFTPSKRPNITQFLQHTWFQSNESKNT